MLPEYDFSGGVRGVYAERFKTMKLKEEPVGKIGARRTRKAAAAKRTPFRLTARERAILKVLSRPAKLSEIAAHLGKEGDSQRVLRSLSRKLESLSLWQSKANSTQGR